MEEESLILAEMFRTPDIADFTDPLEQSIIKHFSDKIKTDDDFCVRLWSSLANVDWYLNGDTTKDYGMSFRSAGSFIAAVRGSGHYMDWYCSGPYATVDSEIAEKLKEDGWTFKEIHTELEDIDEALKQPPLLKRVYRVIRHPIKSYRWWRFTKELEKIRKAIQEASNARSK